MAKLVDSLLMYDQEKRNSKSLTVVIYLFFIFLSIALIFYGSFSIRLLSKDNIKEFGKTSIKNQLVSVQIDRIYSPCGFTTDKWNIAGYYCIAHRTNNEYCILYYDIDTWNENGLGNYFVDDSMAGESYEPGLFNYEGSTGLIDSVIGNKAVKYYKEFIYPDTDDGETYSALFTNYYITPGDRSYLIVAYTLLISGAFLFVVTAFVLVMNFKKKKNTSK